MFEYIALFASAFTIMIQHVFRQKFNEKGAKNAFLFSAITAFVAMLVFVVTNTDWSYDIKYLGFSCIFALSYGTAVVTSLLALLHGPVAKTSLVSACSLIIPSIYGIFNPLRENNEVSLMLIIGLVLIVASLFLVNNEPDDKKPTLKWVIYVFLCFLSNGVSSVVQVVKQDLYGEGCNNVFMIVAFAIVSVALFAMSISKKKSRLEVADTFKKGWLLAVLCGAANGVTNLFSLVLSGRMNPAIVFPVMSGGSMILVFVWSIFIKKERYTTVQYVGYGLGLIAIVLLNIK